MACIDCNRPKSCTKLICCGVCPDRDNCPHGYPCPTCTDKSKDVESNADE